MTKTRYELALDAAAMEMYGVPFNHAKFLTLVEEHKLQAIGIAGLLNKVHTQASKNFAKGFARYINDKGYTAYEDETGRRYFYQNGTMSESELLTIYNQSA